MKKRILSFLLAFVMLVGMLPVQAFAAEKSYVYVSFEVCDAAGNGRTLIKPERNARVRYTNDYALAAMRQAIGSSNDVKYDSDKLCITGVRDTSQSDGFLDNGDIEGYRWIVLRNNAEWDGTDYNTNYKLGDNEVLRCIYTNKSVDEMSAVNKDAFIRYLSEVGENMWYESSAGYAEYMAGLNDMEYVQKQGINGPIWALIALDSGNYPAPEGDVSREALIQVILDAQLADGGWALTGSISDADITGMALQALARYYKTNADVTEAVDKAVAALSMMQAADGSFASVDGGSSESVAQVIAALSALGIDADTDTRFIKNGVSALDALCAFFVEDGGFKHIHDGKLDGMATEQSYYALAAYFRMLDGKPALFDMTDVVDMGGDVTAEEPTETQPAETEPMPTEPVETPVKESRSFPWWLLIVIVVLAGAIVVLVIISKPKKGRHMK